MQIKEISQRFVQFYNRLGFKTLPSTSLLHPSIPMTFVMSAGLAQVETARDQLSERSKDHTYVLVQNCFRHFDVDRIGKSAHHLSLFEMPGAFSFGQIDRAVAIERMWELLIHQLGIDPGRIWATYFSGDTISGHFFPEDSDSRRAWKNMGLPDDRIIGLGRAHNFWKQGGGIDGQEPDRKCGPNTELFYDRGPHLACGPQCRPGSCKCGRFVEFTNSLFIYAQIDAETNALQLMPDPFTETVIGTERVAMILANRPTVFEIDSIRPLMETLRRYYPGRAQETFFDSGASERILVDHLRALLFLTADGAPPPGKGGRRRLMRILIRRVLTQMRLLQIDSPHCLPELAELVVTLEGYKHPELNQGRVRLLEYIDEETAVFEKTLGRGYHHLEQLLHKNEGRRLEGKSMVNLVKQFGMPVALLRAALIRRGSEFNEQAYQQAIEQWQRNVSLKAAGH